MSALIEDYLREVSSSLRVDATRKRQIVDELRTHLTERVADEVASRPDALRDVVEREVLREFGNPRDLALAYEPEGGAPVLVDRRGDIVLRLGQAAKAVGRGTTKLLKITAIALAILLVVALGVGAWAYYEIKPYIPAMIESQEPVYQYAETCVTACSGAPPADPFFVREGADTIRVDLRLYSVHEPEEYDRHLGNGTITVKVLDPTGFARYQRTVNMTDEGRISYESSWAAIAGNWTVEYDFDAFVGRVDIELYAYGFPKP